MLTVFPCYAPQDRDLVRDLAAFLERGAGVRVFLNDGEIQTGQTLISKGEEALSADVILVILSPDSVPARWVREQWEPVFRDQPQEAGVPVGVVLNGDCRYPPLLARANFFDLKEGRRQVFRALKRWVISLRPATLPPTVKPAHPQCFTGREACLDELRATVADQAGIVVLEGPPGTGKTALAQEFATRHAEEFERVLWLNCSGRSLHEMLGDLAVQLHLRMEGDTAAGLSVVRPKLEELHCLLVLDGVETGEALPLIRDAAYPALITSRNYELWDEFSFGKIEPGVFTGDEALQLLDGSQAAGRDTGTPPRPVLRELAAGLGFDPLAVTVAARFLQAGRAEPADLLAAPGCADTRRNRDGLIELVTLSISDAESALLAAAAACSPGGFRPALAQAVCGLSDAVFEEAWSALLSLSLIEPLDLLAPRFRLPGGLRETLAGDDPEWRLRHAGAVCRQFAAWSTDQPGCQADFADLHHASAWALECPGDEARYQLGVELVRRGFSFASSQGRLAEAFGLMSALFRAAEHRDDKRALDQCAREQAWILERWGRDEEARALHHTRLTRYSDQLWLFPPETEGLFG